MLADVKRSHLNGKLKEDEYAYIGLLDGGDWVALHGKTTLQTTSWSWASSGGKLRRPSCMTRRG